MSKKIPIHFSDLDLKEIDHLIHLLGQKDTYGALPRAVKFSIDLAIITLENYGKSIPGLKTGNLDLFLASIERIKKRDLLMKEAQTLKDHAQKV